MATNTPETPETPDTPETPETPFEATTPPPSVAGKPPAKDEAPDGRVIEDATPTDEEGIEVVVEVVSSDNGTNGGAGQGTTEGTDLCGWCARPTDAHQVPCPDGVIEVLARCPQWARGVVENVLADRKRMRDHFDPAIHEIATSRTSLRALVDAYIILDEGDPPLTEHTPLDYLISLAAEALEGQRDALEQSHNASVVFSQLAHVLDGKPIPAGLGDPHSYTRRLQKVLKANANLVLKEAGMLAAEGAAASVRPRAPAAPGAPAAPVVAPTPVADPPGPETVDQRQPLEAGLQSCFACRGSKHAPTGEVCGVCDGHGMIHLT